MLNTHTTTCNGLPVRPTFFLHTKHLFFFGDDLVGVASLDDALGGDAGKSERGVAWTSPPIAGNTVAHRGREGGRERGREEGREREREGGRERERMMLG